MTDGMPKLTQFRIEEQDNGLIHLVFDCPERTMNVFSNKAIHELGAFADWLRDSDVRGVVVRSGKATGFCAGADLTELGVAYNMIVDAPEAVRFDLAFDHFFPLSHAIRRMERAGKPIAAAIAGVALGGGCELTLGCHYRVATNEDRTMLGLPESKVGLLPGAGGTQRMPRIVGLELGLEILLHGKNLQGEAAVSAGLVDKLVAPGEEIAAAEAWLLSDAAHATQPWDRTDHVPQAYSDIGAAIAAAREAELARMLGHEPAPLAILDCVEYGLVQPIDGAIRAEMSVFANLIQRAEPRNMIHGLFLGKQAFDKARRKDAIPTEVTAAVAKAKEAVQSVVSAQPALSSAGFGNSGGVPVQTRAASGYWAEGQGSTAKDARAALAQIKSPLRDIANGLSDGDRLIFDHMLVREGVVPAYLGGSIGIIDRDWD